MTGGRPPTVSVSLLNYRGLPFVDACVRALRALDPAPLEIIAVDNASPDGSGERLRALAEADGGPPIRYVPAGRNLGYAAGHNLAARHARGEFLAFLNVTVEPQTGWLAVAPWMAERPDVAFVQPAIFHRDDPTRLESLGSIYRRSGWFRVVGRNHREPRAAPAGPYVAEVFSVLGAAFLARRDVFERLGGFDESMFMYFEETDLCWRGWLTGARSLCYFDPARPMRAYHTTHGTHPKGFASARYFERNRTLAMYRNLAGRNLPWLLPGVGRVLSEQARHPRRLARYLAEVATALPAAAARRRSIQAGRTVPDERIFALAPGPALSNWFEPPAPGEE